MTWWGVELNFTESVQGVLVMDEGTDMKLIRIFELTSSKVSTFFKEWKDLFKML